MTLRAKINWSIAVLLALMFMVMAGGGVAFYRLEQDSANRMSANLRTLRYVHTMHQALAALATEPTDAHALGQFKDAYAQEARNITEPGEAAAVARLGDLLSRYATQPQVALLPQMGQVVQHISDLNLDALETKELQAQETATWYGRMLITLATCVILALIFFFSHFPSAVLGPIRLISEHMRAIAGGNYQLRMDDNRNDELGLLAQTFNQMATELEAYRQSRIAELMHEQARLQAVMRVLPDGLLLLSEQQHLVACNTVAAQALNLPAPESNLPHPETLAKQNDLFRTLYTLDKPAAEPLEIRTPGQDVRYFIPARHLLISPPATPDSPGEALGTLLVLQDVTAVHRTHLAKSKFLATVSHELNTPLATLQLSLQLLNDKRVGQLNPEQQDLLARLEEARHRMQQMVHAVLDMSRLDAVGVELKPQTIEAQVLVHEAMATLHTQASQKGVRITLSAGHAHHYVMADPEKTLWVLTNLLGNALRYSPDNGRIRIELSKEDTRLRFSVTDQGPGIPEAFRQKLFDRFATFSVAGQGKSYGLGLAIASEFVVAQGGQMGVQNNPERGATFWFTLPIAA